MKENGLIKKSAPVIKFRSNKLSKNSLKIYSLAISQYYRYCSNANIEPGKDSAKRWLETFNNAKTYNLKRIALKEHLLKLYENEPADRQLELIKLFEEIPTNKVKHEITTDWLTIDQIELLTEKCKSKEMTLIIWALFWTGCRVNELLNIKISDCVSNGEISIRIIGKGRKEREVYLPKDLFKKIKKTFSHSKIYLFETRKNTQFHSNNISEYIRRAGKRMNLSISSHTLRHSKAMYLKNVRGLSPDQVAKALGHSSILTTLQFYFHGTPSAKEQGIE